MKELKLFVWTDFCPDYTPGLAFAIAETQQEAMEKVKDKNDIYVYQWGELHIHDLDEDIAYAVMGGG